MPRFHLKQLAALAVCSACLVVLVIFLRNHGPSVFKKDVQEDPDTALWALIKPPKTEAKVLITPPPPPQIHVKKLPSLSINPNWTAQQMEHTFFKYLENKDIRCENDMRLGNWHDGGWNVCLSPPYTMAAPCVVFSFGVGNDWQFDDSISTMFGCRVLAFDPSMSEPDERRSPLIEFRKMGLGPANAVNKDGWKMKTLSQHIRDEGYWGIPVDYVKVDIEFSEWAVLQEAFKDEGTLRYVKQFGIEIHTPDLFNIYHDQVAAAKDVRSSDPLSPIGLGGSSTNPRRIFVHMFEALHRLEILGFRKFNYRKNPYGSYKSNITGLERSCCYELHYINSHFLSDNFTIVHTKDDKLFH
ncbi:methyltransferase-like protein 24 [Plakobranchus ocellatus]|uniref:Methyltransferase-like protein 24 n=1 Tax=Plakobranchus ocellatus TaxID=259542 RepID=A0AAV4CCH2_9GAST|nr:methyltransferase-like protein 24 [Plakobranchus ocellatus]